jgi:nicotinamidase-related amidase
MKRIWDSYLSERDREIFKSAGYGARSGFGAKPALLVVDVTYGFTGDRPEPIAESVKRWKNSCGEESWPAIKVIDRLAKVFRQRRLPVIYSAGIARVDNWDACSWAWKNARVETKAVPRSPDLPDENEIVAEIAPHPQDIVIRKQKPSAFYGTHLQSYLTYLGCDTLVVTGVSTSGCVRATVVDAFSANYKTIVVEDGCFDRGQASHAITLFDLDGKYSDVVDSQFVEDHVSTLPDNLFPNLPSS